jgi:Predicted nucleic acid-binding protein, contains PIN domain
MILLDTDVCVELLRGNKNVLKRIDKCNDDIGISFITVGELFYGVYKSKYIENNLSLLEEFILSVTIIESNYQIMKEFGIIKSKLYKQKTMITDADIMIAATCIITCEKLITGNIRHYNRIDGLIIEDWIH